MHERTGNTVRSTPSQYNRRFNTATTAVYATIKFVYHLLKRPPPAKKKKNSYQNALCLPVSRLQRRPCKTVSLDVSEKRKQTTQR